MKKRLSIFLISVGLILTTNSSLMSITGYVINENFKITGSVLGLAFIIGGLVLFLAKEGRLEKNLAQQILAGGKILRKPREFKKLANQMGYSLGKSYGEGTRVLKEDGTILTIIPGHNISQGVYYKIVKALATGESNFRRRPDYQPA